MGKKKLLTAEAVLDLLERLGEEEQKRFWHFVAVNPAYCQQIVTDPKARISQPIDLTRQIEEKDKKLKAYEERLDRMKVKPRYEMRDRFILRLADSGLRAKEIVRRVKAERPQWAVNPRGEPLTPGNVNRIISRTRSRMKSQ